MTIKLMVFTETCLRMSVLKYVYSLNISIEIRIRMDCCILIINCKINGTPKGAYLKLISKLHSILAMANLLAHNNLWLYYYGQVNSLLK